ncbi:uncharacterized protein FOMMEDRAFT_22444 [Fomitiporia mediterranea MF3/22]|uniref:uncharacterized protein n=1 Tax=Fomitiporia mediterranea (strain MF3/22) TaxID=694068 RepID=UPI000440977B|nr:uncharacterized protein FOMMEDRAFT_22444 [Fomitiporia mediterranea MF3/22]EJC99965.1 hypothetical protein FOMMEDRAFT_22444 [Fomitiporia mediterranea MF3/22]
MGTPTTSRRTRRKPVDRRPKLLSDSTDSETPSLNLRKRRGAPLQAVKNKRAKFDADSIVVDHSRVAPEPQVTTQAPKPKPSRSGSKLTREELLRDDSNAEVLGPDLVRCRLCKGNIKFSIKDRHGVSVWRRHIGRCLLEQVDRNAEDSQANDAIGRVKRSGRRIIRVSPGSSPLKLKITLANHGKSQTPRAQSNSSDAGGQVTMEGGECHDIEAEQATSTPSEQPFRCAPLHRKTMSAASTVSDTNIETPLDVHGELPAIVVGPSSSNSNAEEMESDHLEPKLSYPDERWTDGPHMTSPEQMVFPEKFGDHGDAAASVLEEPISGIDNARIGGTSAAGNEIPLKRAVVKPVNIAEFGIPQSPQPSVSESPLPDDPALEFPAASQNNAPLSSPHQSLSESSALQVLGNSEADETDFYHLDFLYPDSEPPICSGELECELREAGLGPENLYNYHSFMESVARLGRSRLQDFQNTGLMVPA